MRAAAPRWQDNVQNTVRLNPGMDVRFLVDADCERLIFQMGAGSVGEQHHS